MAQEKRSVREKIIDALGTIALIALLVGFFFLHFGLNLVISGLSTVAYVAGTRTDAVVTKINVTRPVGDDADELGATAVYIDTDGRGHELFVQGRHPLNQHVAVAYLSFRPEFGVVIKDYEQSLPITIVGCAISLGVILLVVGAMLRAVFSKKRPDKSSWPTVDATPPFGYS